jgi:hypothetical protein
LLKVKGIVAYEFHGTKDLSLGYHSAIVRIDRHPGIGQWFLESDLRTHPSVSGGNPMDDNVAIIPVASDEPSDLVDTLDLKRE